MKYFKIPAILLFTTVIFFYACNDNSKAPPPRAKIQNPASLEPPQNASGVWHYTCSKRCAGGSGSAGNCNTCGSLLVHNSLYHVNSTPNAPIAPTNAPFATPPANTTGKNIAGVWHYSCKKGCAGGSGVAGSCVTCGDTLAHNQAYHQ